LTLPFRLIGITFEALFAALRALLFLPARLVLRKSSIPVSLAVTTGSRPIAVAP
jgi:hypothetical protein